MKRRWLLGLLAVLFIWVVVTRISEVKQLIAVLAQGQAQWVAVAAVVQGLYFVIFALSYQSAFGAIGLYSRFREVLPVVLATIFVNTAAPSGGAGGAALFADDATQRGQSGARAAAGTLLQNAADYGAFTLVLVVGLVYLFIHHDLQVYEIIAAAVLLLIVAGLCAIFMGGLWWPKRLRRLLGWVQHTANMLAARLKRADLLATDWAERIVDEFGAAAAAVSAHPALLGRTLAATLGAHVVDLVCLYALFLAFHQPVGLGVLVAGFAMGVLFWIVAITPQGIGVVEGVMALTFTSLGVPAANATVIALAFRGLTL